MIKAIALDDEPPALEIIEAFCKKIDVISLEKTFTKTSDAFRYLEKFPVDLLLLDINMPSSTGIEFYRSIPQQAMVIFTTSYSGYVAFQTKERLDNSSVTLQAGKFNTFKTLGLFNLVNTDKQAAYLATEYLMTDGPFISPQRFNRLNLMGKYTAYLNDHDRLYRF